MLEEIRKRKRGQNSGQRLEYRDIIPLLEQ